MVTLSNTLQALPAPASAAPPQSRVCCQNLDATPGGWLGDLSSIPDTSIRAVMDLSDGGAHTRRDRVAGPRGGPAGDRPRARGDLPGPGRERGGRRRRGPGGRGPAPGRRLRRGARPRLGRGDRGLLAAGAG